MFSWCSTIIILNPTYHFRTIKCHYHIIYATYLYLIFFKFNATLTLYEHDERQYEYKTIESLLNDIIYESLAVDCVHELNLLY